MNALEFDINRGFVKHLTLNPNPAEIGYNVPIVLFLRSDQVYTFVQGGIPILFFKARRILSMICYFISENNTILAFSS